ncbi:MAG TPA: PilZ domain-containing protein [Acetivibrio sp.]|nr:PilZ domain-containing protein [Acetivibrio sp.]
MSKNTPTQSDSNIFCKVSINNDGNWIYGIITYLNLDKNIAEIFLPARFFKSYLKEGSKVLVKAISDNNETLFSGSITRKVISIRKQAVTVQLDSIMSFENKRNYERFYVNYPCKIREENSIAYMATLADISFKGGLVYTENLLEEGKNVIVDIYLNPSMTLTFSGKIARKLKDKNRGFCYGIELTKIDEENSILLNEVIECLVNKREQIAYEWKVFKRLKYAIYAISVLGIFLTVFSIFITEVL